jgi:hypothetical protein
MNSAIDAKQKLLLAQRMQSYKKQEHSLETKLKKRN